MSRRADAGSANASSASAVPDTSASGCRAIRNAVNPSNPAVSIISTCPWPGTESERSDPPTDVTMPAGAVHATQRQSISCSRR